MRRMTYHQETPEEIKENLTKNVKYNTKQGSRVSCSLILVLKGAAHQWVPHISTLPPEFNRGNFQIPEEAWTPGLLRQEENAK